jgi:hypothetical protein
MLGWIGLVPCNAWLVGWLVGRSVGWLVGLRVGLLNAWLVGWLVGWLAGWLIGWFAFLVGCGWAGLRDCVALLNVLDRCDTPRTLMAQLRDLVLPEEGRLLLAVVLPFRPFVEDGTERREPAEQLHLPPNGSFEESLDQLWREVLQPLGFRLEAVSRVPYMSDGDTRCPVYVLDDAVLVLSVPNLPPRC